MHQKICQFISERVNNETRYEQFYQENKGKDFLYDCFQNIIYSKDLMNINAAKTNNLKNINFEFFEGFGNNI